MSAPREEIANGEGRIAKGDSSGTQSPGAAGGRHDLARLLADAVRRYASDLLLVADAPPTIFAAGKWAALHEQRMTREAIASCIEPLLTVEHRDRLNLRRDLDLSFAINLDPEEGSIGGAQGRCRVNIHYQRGGLAVAIRLIPDSIPRFEQLGLPPQVLGLADYPNGLVLVTGGAGQGKSTTMAALIEHMNRTRSGHLITIEDPIEFSFRHGTCIIEQRQVGEDSPSFAAALRHILRQRPDVIFIGEMRDTETMATALTAAETGHLVMATLHTSSAAQTLARIIDVFPPAQQPQIRTQLAGSIRAILCQALVADPLNETLVPATELMIATSAVRRAIRENETHLIYSMIETGRRNGMHTLEQSLEGLVRSGRVSAADALAVAADSARMKKMVGHLDQSADAVPVARPLEVAEPIGAGWMPDSDG